MARLSDLVLRTSEVTGVPEPAVREMGRRLREAGLISTGKGGRYGGAEMTSVDAARLVTSLMIAKASTFSHTKVVPLAKAYLTGLISHSGRRGHLVVDRWNAKLGLFELCELKIGHTFEDAVAALFSSMATSSFKSAMQKWGTVRIRIELSDPKPDYRALVTISTGKIGNFGLFYFPRQFAQTLQPANIKNWSDIRTDYRFDLRARTSISESTLKHIGALLSADAQA